MMRKILSGQSRNKGVTLITLIIAITIFAVFITVFSYVMIAKHGSEALYVQSTQAYTIAQAGIEYGIRYATIIGYWAAGSPGITNPNPLGSGSGSGSFTLVYTQATMSTTSKLTSTGTVGNAVRQIILSNFVGFVSGKAISKDPHDPPS
ncbi:MAG: hypothetical protein KKI12_01935 [Proteobacteria bacterium]|nr:hypothetical protein [Pseudomonadota bacterium]MCG2758264.1 hypothetical protein [Desulfobacteraceae bacterium]